MSRKSQSENLKYNLETKEIIFDNEEKKADRSEKKGIIYARVSTEEQKQKGSGIVSQIIDCERWAKNNGVKVICEPFKDEAISGTNLQRKGFLEAIRFIEKENKKGLNIDYFICASTSRFSRSHKISDTFDMVARVEATGAKLVAVGNGGVQDTESEEGLLMFGLNTIIDAVESKRGQKRVRYGQKGKIYEGLRPFPDVPVGYERITEKVGGKEMKILIKNEEKAKILKEGLQLFAEGVLLTKHQLYEFFKERGLKSNSKKNKTGKLHESIIDKILDLWKLYVYAGYLTYPDWGINELIPAKHPQIITLEIVDKIMQRLNKDKGITDHKKRGYDQDADEYPLKRILLCPECNKGVTKWKSRSKTGDYHHYYGCNNKECKLFKKSLPRDQVHEAIRDRLKEITPPEEGIKLFEKLFMKERKQAEKDLSVINKEKNKKIKLIEDEMNRIEKMLDNVTDNALFTKKQQRRAELNQEKENIEYEMQDSRFTQNEFEKVYNEAKLVITRPLALWDLEDVEIKQLLIRVCFNNKIYYKKNQGLHTPEISGIYFTFGQLSLDKTSNLEITSKMLNSMQSELFRMQYIYTRIDTILKENGYLAKVKRL